MSETIDRILKAAVDRGAVPGVAAMVVSRDATLYANGFGRRSPQDGADFDPQTVCAIASMTKALTSCAALQLVEQGMLSLDAPAGEILPWLGEVEVLTGFASDGTPQTRPPKTPITLRHLLSHTAGFGYAYWNRELADYEAATGAPSVSTRTLAGYRKPLLFDPGTRWNYGINTDWTGLLMEAAGGARLGTLLTRQLLEPLGMRETAFTPTEAMQTRLAAIHQRDEAGGLSVSEALRPTEPEVDAGGGGLFSSVADYARFCRMILNDGRAEDGTAVLDPDSLAALRRNETGDRPVTALRTQMPALSRDAEFFPGVRKAWSLGFMLNLDQAPTGRSAGSLSWAGLTNCYCWIDPARDLAGIFMTQILPFFDIRALPLFLEFETAVYRDLAR